MCAECHQTPCHPRCPNAPEPKAIFICESCGEAICEGDDAYEIGGAYYHEECAEDNALEILVELFDARKFTAEPQEDGWYD